MTSPTPDGGADQGLHDVPPADQGLHDVPPAQQGAHDVPQQEPVSAQRSKTPLLVGIGAAIVVIIGILAAIFH